jgi:Cu/Ag efflux pump CusA
MNFRNISAWSIRNPVVPLVLFAGLLLAGLVSFARLDVNNNPDIDFPAVQVSIVQPGAAPTEIETQITSASKPRSGRSTGSTRSIRRPPKAARAFSSSSRSAPASTSTMR